MNSLGAPSAEQLRKQAHSLFEQKDWQGAHDAYGAVLAIEPEDPLALVQLSRIEIYLGCYRDAQHHAMTAKDLQISDLELVAALMSRLRAFCEYRAIDTIVEKLPPVDRISIPALMALSVELNHHGDPDKALRYVEEALRGDPDYPPTLMAMGNLLTNFGKFEKAEKYLDRCIELAPGMTFAYWLISKLRRQTPESNHIGKMIRLLSGSPQNMSPANQSLLYYSLHKELDDVGDHPAAWEALTRACTAKRSSLKYSRDETRLLVDGLINWSVDASAQTSAVIPAGAPTPIFIVGMHRSGTTLLEQLLDGHPGVKGAGEIYDFTSQMRYATDRPCAGPVDQVIVERARGVDFAEIGARYLEKAAWRVGSHEFHTDKLPSNFLNIGFICHALPQAKILHMVRDPVETCFSNLRELFSDVNPYSYDQAELADYYLQYRRLMAYWHQTFPGRIMDVDYAELTRDPDGTMRKVATFCGIDYVEAMRDPRSSTRAVSTASVVQVRDKVVSREVPKWTHYRQQLQPLMAALRAGGVTFED